MDLKKFNEDNGSNFLLMSKVPEACRREPCVLGVDEAGRGPVLGPMVYGIAYCPVSRNGDLKSLGVDDSKALTEHQREELLAKLVAQGVDGGDHGDHDGAYVGWAVHVLSPLHISRSMYKRCKYNLNSISHDTAIGLIKAAQEAGVRVSEVYVDTVGPPEKYQEKLSRIFPELKVTVAKKADSLFPCVSAASICAKVARDQALRDWRLPDVYRNHNGDKESDVKWGSGYPGDPVTKKFLRESLHPVFGFPSIVRFSWKTAETLLDEKGAKVEFEEVEPEEDPELKKNPSIRNYLVAAPATKRNNPTNSNKAVLWKQPEFFRRRKLTSTTLESLLSSF